MQPSRWVPCPPAKSANTGAHIHSACVHTHRCVLPGALPALGEEDRGDFGSSSTSVIQLTLEQRGFELHGSTSMQIFFNKYIGKVFRDL